MLAGVTAPFIIADEIVNSNGLSFIFNYLG
jgi:hypothetical protein